MKLYKILFLASFVLLTVTSKAQTWTGLGDVNNWNDPANWDTNPSLPSNGDNIIINSAHVVTLSVNSSFTPADITIEGGAELIISTNGDISTSDDMFINGSTSKLTIAGGVLSNSDNITVTDGAIEMTSGTFNNDGKLEINDGALSISGGTLNQNGTGGISDDIILTNTSFDLSGGSIDNKRGLTMTNGSLNISGGSWDNGGTVPSDDMVFNGTDVSFSAGTITNDRAWDMTGGSFTLSGSATLTNTGVNSTNDNVLFNGTDIDIAGGTLNNTRSLTVTGGTFDMTSGTINQTASNDSNDVTFSNTTMTMNGTAPGGTIQTSQEIYFDGGTIDISSGLIDSYKNVTIQNGADFALASSDAKIEIGDGNIPRYDLIIEGSTTDATFGTGSRVDLSGEVDITDATVSIAGTIDAVTLRAPDAGGDLRLFGSSTVSIQDGASLLMEDIRFADDGENSTLNVHGDISSVDDLIFHETANDPIPNDTPGDNDQINIYGTMAIGDNIQGLDGSGSSIVVYDGGELTADGWGSSQDVDEIFGDEITTFGTGTADIGEDTLPVDLIGFSAGWDGTNIVINWTTATEKNNDFFEIHRSHDGEDFQVIGTVGGSGNSSIIVKYSFTDAFVEDRSVYYYRLKQVDFDGASELFYIIRVDPTGSDLSSFEVFPNPIYNQLVSISNLPDGNLLISILDLEGHVVLEKSLTAGLKNRSFKLPMQKVQSGQYVLILSDKLTEKILGTRKILIKN